MINNVVDLLQSGLQGGWIDNDGSSHTAGQECWHSIILLQLATRDEFQPQLMQTFDRDKVQTVATMDGMFNGALETINKIIYVICQRTQDIWSIELPDCIVQ